MKRKRILGVDPGSLFTGYGVIEDRDGSLVPITYGVIKTGGSSVAFPTRLKKIYDGLLKVIEEHQPNEAAVETIFFAKNVGSAIKLGQARGAALTAIMSRCVQVSEYSPTQIKQGIVGYGRSEKEQIQKMVCMILGLNAKGKVFSRFDVTDALAVAICHFHSNSFMNKLMTNDSKRAKNKNHDRTT